MSNFKTEQLQYSAGNTVFSGTLVYDADIATPLPGLLMAPNWMGVSASAVRQAQLIASHGYVVLVADLYGAGKRPENADQAAAYMGEIRNKPEEVTRLRAALEALLTQQQAKLSSQKIAAAGFCFGGHNVLELARSGADIRAAVSFHGNLDTSGLYNATITCPLLVLHGAKDPVVPVQQLTDFVAEMALSGTDWQLISYADAAHSFTDPDANTPDMFQYHPEVAARAFQSLFSLLADNQ